MPGRHARVAAVLGCASLAGLPSHEPPMNCVYTRCVGCFSLCSVNFAHMYVC